MRRQTALVLLALATTACFKLSAQYRFDSWTTENGLPGNAIWALRQTSDGYLWMTTSSAFVRFDGLRFREFNRGNTPGLTAEGFTAYTLLEDRQGCLWAGTWTGGAVRECHGGFTTFTTKDGLPGNRVIRIDQDEEGTVWFFTDPGLAKWQDGRIVRVAPEPGSPFNDVLIAPKGNVGVDGYLFGLWRVGKKGWQRFAFGHWSEVPLPPEASDASELRIDSIVEDSKARLWYTFYHSPGTYYCLNQGRLTTFTKLPRDGFVSYQDTRGNLWESAHNGRTNLWKDGKITPLDGFSTSFVFRGLEDREGSLWLGTKEGFLRAAATLITTHRNNTGPEGNLIEPVIEDRAGGIWYGSRRGLFHWSGGRLENLTRVRGALQSRDARNRRDRPSLVVSALYQDNDGRIWAGTWDGPAYLSGGVLVSDGPSVGVQGQVSAIHRDRSANLWVGSERGLYRIQGSTLTHFTRQDGLGNDAVQVIREGRSGTLWIGTAAGLSVREGNHFAPVAATESLESRNITTLYEDIAGVLWIGTFSEGLYRLEHGKLTHYTAANGLFTTSVFQILEDDQGFFWLSSPTGIHRVKKTDLDAIAAGRQATLISTGFGRTDGMISVECTAAGQPAGIKARDGKLWFPTTDGLAILDPQAAQVNSHPPPVLIEEALVDGRTLAGGQAVTLTPGKLSLDIQYTALSLIKSGQIRFRYKMEGLDPDWIDAGTRRTAYYTRIPPGGYTFRVIAANSDGVWNLEGASLAVSVLPQFYRTWWFEALSFLCVSTLIAMAWRYRISQLERAQELQQAFSRQLIGSQEEERKRIAAELHDSLGQRLIIVKNLALLYLRAQGEEAVSTGKVRTIEEISDEAAMAIDETRAISYNLRPFQLDRLGLSKAIEGMIRTVSAVCTTEFRLELDNVDEAFPEDLRINFYRIVQESMNNIVKHAQATEAVITIRRTAKQVLLTIRDNGRGFTPGSTNSESGSGGFGVTGMAERARLLGGELTVQAAPGRGAVVAVRIPLREKKL